MTDSRWDALLVWLAGHGMDIGDDGLLVERRARPGAGYGLFARKHCPPSTTLFTIPSSALLNSKTLSPHYPGSGELNATSLISFHLLLHRPPGNGESNDRLFGPYISVLPRDFDSHPLTWLIRSKLGKEITQDQELLGHLPSQVLAALSGLWRRFLKDWRSVCHYATRHPVSVTSSTRSMDTMRFSEVDAGLTMDFAWAWLIVNTRCLSYRLKPSVSDPDNLTLCPILDFANHNPDSALSMQPIQTTPVPPLRKGRDCALMASANVASSEGEELYLTYGAHSNVTLFAEYGFVNAFTADMILEGRFAGDLDVQDAIEALFGSMGPKRGEWLKCTLEHEGYWGDWTLHSAPSPAHPSFRLITALRLHSLADKAIGELSAQVLQSWRAVHLGLRECISQTNEASWRETLMSVCSGIKSQAAECLGNHDRSGHGGSWMEENIRLLWIEQYSVAEAVIKSLDAGHEF